MKRLNDKPFNLVSIFLSVCLMSVNQSFAEDSTSSEQLLRDALQAPQEAYEAELKNSNQYKIKPGDALEILVWKEPELSKELIVAPDGYLSLPLVGQVFAQGKRLAEFQEELTEQLSDYIPEPSVTVVLLSVLGNKFYVLGKVNRPGEFAMSYPISVLQALSMAGGMSTYADADKIRIIRQTEEGEEAIRFNYDQVVKGKHLEQNIQLKSGDVLLVP